MDNMYWVLATTYRIVLSISQIFTHLIHIITLGRKEGSYPHLKDNSKVSIKWLVWPIWVVGHLRQMVPAGMTIEVIGLTHLHHLPSTWKTEGGSVLPHTCSASGDQPRRCHLSTSNNTLLFSVGGAGEEITKPQTNQHKVTSHEKGLAKL